MLSRPGAHPRPRPLVGRRHLLRATGLAAAVVALGAGDHRRQVALVPPTSARTRETAPVPARRDDVSVPAPTIVPFDEWASDACPQPTGHNPTPVQRLVVHHTVEPTPSTPDEVLWALERMCDAHTDRGFDTLGYHYLVDAWGRVWQGRGGLPGPDGRPPERQPEGAHVAGSNEGAVGVAFIGDHAAGPPTDDALHTATHLLAWLLEPTGLDPHQEVAVASTGAGTARFTGTFHPRAIAGHSASNVTECPGRHLEARLDDVRDGVERWLRGDGRVTT